MLQSVGIIIIIIIISSRSVVIMFWLGKTEITNKSSSMHMFRSLPSTYVVVQHTSCRTCLTSSSRKKFLLFYFLKMLHQEMKDCFCCCVSIRFLVCTCLQGTVLRHRNTFAFIIVLSPQFNSMELCHPLLIITMQLSIRWDVTMLTRSDIS
jgi:hypothetical protein